MTLPFLDKKPSERWPSFAEFAEEVQKKGFQIQFKNSADEELVVKNWEKLSTPVRPEDNNNQAHYSFLSDELMLKNLKTDESWGWMILDDKLLSKYTSENSSPVMFVNQADALFDFVLKSLSAVEWAGESAQLPDSLIAESGVHIGPDCEFGRGVVLEKGVRLGRGVKIGDGTRIGAFTTLRDFSIVGAGCQIGSHCSIGNPGFGLLQYPKSHFATQRVHLGRVRIGSGVRLGSFVAVDRSVLSETVVGDGTSVDNFIQIAHNCELGRGNVLVAYVGLSGSTKTGDGCVFGARAGTQEHVTLGKGVTVAGQTDVTKSLPDGAVVKGYPPRPLKEQLKIQVLQGKLPDFARRLKLLEEQILKK